MKKVFILVLIVLAFCVSGVSAMDAKGLMESYALHNQHCLACHDSVADPEKPGFTQDTWFLILNIMHDKYGMESLSVEDKGKLTDYLYTIRKGIEREAG
ncbi:MAG: hypothetical protein JXQ81_13150 [Desulfuromonadales bacterium]|nr:hypothetical protein [Desulfuromonadales bacterium]MBN2793451.1 hypothetical protein [Desulfuromonadales bacterium]